jgi:hypothetical protein
MSDVGEGPQGGDPGHRHHRGLLEGRTGRLDGELVFVRGGVVGEGATAEAEHFITY